MSAVTNLIPFATKQGAEEYLLGLGFVYVKCLKQWFDEGTHWATVEQLPSGKWLVKVGVTTAPC